MAMSPEQGWLPYYCTECGREMGSYYYRKYGIPSKEERICVECKKKRGKEV